MGNGSYPAATTTASSSPTPSHAPLPATPIPSAPASKLDISLPGSDYATLLDLSTLQVIPKSVRPLDKQLPHESRKLWENVTNRLVSKEFGEATKEKVNIEQKQRDEAADRKKKGIE